MFTMYVHPPNKRRANNVGASARPPTTPAPGSAHINTGTQPEPAVWHADACINRSSLQSIGLCWCWCVAGVLEADAMAAEQADKQRPRPGIVVGTEQVIICK